MLDHTEGWSEANVRPLWENRRAHGNAAAAAPAPMLWRWETMLPLIDRAGALRSMEATERRVLSLVDPAYDDNGSATVRNLNAGLQILLPGERARPHRHSMNAIRFVLAGRGATTVVDGKACPMDEGDLVLTPGLDFHAPRTSRCCTPPLRARRRGSSSSRTARCSGASRLGERIHSIPLGARGPAHYLIDAARHDAVDRIPPR